MSSRFEQAITAGVLAGTIALTGCGGSSSAGGEGGDGPVLESAVAFFDLGGGGGGPKGVLLPEVDGEPEQGNTVELTFSEAVQVGDAEAAAAAFLLAESVGTRVQTGTTSSTSCLGSTESGGCTDTATFTSPLYAYQEPFGACVSAEGTLADQCEPGQRAAPLLSTMEPAARVSEADPRILILDYTAAGGFSLQQLHGGQTVLAFRLRFTDSDSHPVQNLDGETLASFNFPDADQSGNVDIALVGGGGSGPPVDGTGCQQEVCLSGLNRLIR